MYGIKFILYISYYDKFQDIYDSTLLKKLSQKETMGKFRMVSKIM